ncbi:MAG: hypothetical protein UY58_C0002G0017 [Candidatus Magasanikbacteria bacterium GW2011_GWA2_50_22]|uniref:Uncharacterized protein n=1 Tax=Candidatus Magasanikbacteria bacterium GW2011_GWA2_50_22 TaxID=1619043 RepID=A0A0G1WFG1_9BACT|nr:MAG: hypothetical protein UY58_C0002G0017 [Candidatus Magasanikbacteria bacterium GW2011_GWA2_50_22]
MANNGLGAEQGVLKGLERLGFKLAPRSARLDEVYKVDAIVLAPPLSEGNYFFPQPLAVQVTTRPEDWTKRAEFLAVARAVGARLVYMELKGMDVNGEVQSAVAAGLNAVFYDASAPTAVLLTVRDNSFALQDLAATMVQFKSWLETIIPGELSGTINFWLATERLGFLEAELPAPGEPDRKISMPAYVHESQIADQSLRMRLRAYSGDLPVPERIPVLFNDGGWQRREHWRKAASHVRLRQDG